MSINITFLIGNGFDLNLGLKTRYSDFLDSYLKKESTNNIIEEFKKDISKDEDAWSYAEKEFGKYTERFGENGKSAEDFCECHEDFCYSLSEFLINEERRMNYEFDKLKIKRGFANGIRNIYLGFRDDEMNLIKSSINAVGGGERYNFIIFNYTRTVDKCINLVSEDGVALLGSRKLGRDTYSNSFGDVVHVHGYTDDDMVLGVNDETQLAKPSIFDNYPEEYKNQIIKKNTNLMNGRNIDQKALDILNQSDVIYIYGMSIGDTDNLWWDRVVRLMKIKSRARLIIHMIPSERFGFIRRKYISFVNRKKEEFLSHSEFYSSLDNDERKTIIERIHICIDNIFEQLYDLATDDSKLLDDSVILEKVNA